MNFINMLCIAHVMGRDRNNNNEKKKKKMRDAFVLIQFILHLMEYDQNKFNK